MSAKVRDVACVVWTVADSERLKFRWAEGWSAGTIGKELGRTRNSVIGRVHRMKLQTVGHQNNHQKVRVKRVVIPKIKRKEAPFNIPIDVTALRSKAWEPLESSVPVALQALDHRCCKWPVGLESPFLFCAARTDVNSSWCPIHRAMAFSNRPLVRL